MSESHLAIVTGGAGLGIGSGISAVLADQGWRVLIVDCDEDATATVIDQISSGGGQVRGLSVDLTCLDAPSQIVDAAQRWAGRIDGLVNNAAISLPADIGQLTDQNLDRMLALNLHAVIRLMRDVGRVLTRPSGSIVNIGSVHAGQTLPGFTAYAATKGAVVSATRAAAVDLGTAGIRVNCILPGLVDSPMSRRVANESGTDAEAYFKSWATCRQLLPDLVTPSDVGQLVGFLLGPQSSRITGQTIAIDGGTMAMLTDRDTH